MFKGKVFFKPEQPTLSEKRKNLKLRKTDRVSKSLETMTNVFEMIKKGSAGLL